MPIVRYSGIINYSYEVDRVCYRKEMKERFTNEGNKVDMANVKDVCDFILFHAHNCVGHKLITNLWLQKTLYYVFGEYYKAYNRDLFSCDFEAWQYGPVCPEAYLLYHNRQKQRGSLELERPMFPTRITETTEEENRIIEIIYSCAEYTAAELVDKTHNEDPWKNASSNGTNVGIGVRIPSEEIRSWFAQN